MTDADDEADDLAREAARQEELEQPGANPGVVFEAIRKSEAEDEAKKNADPETRLLRGCSPALVAAAVVILVLGAGVALKVKSDNDNKESAACSSAPARKDGLRLIACVNRETQSSEQVSNESTESATTSGKPLGSSPGNNASGATAVPPDPASLPPGAILFKGTSGDQIGCIACDGASRFLSITGPGVAVGDAAGTGIAFTWEKAGKVVSFGANLNTGSNKGRYGFNVFRNVPAVPPTTSPSGEGDGGQYRAGCAIEIGDTACRSDREGAPLAAGDKVTIIIGEAGTGTGTYTCDWWFVFQPDA